MSQLFAPDRRALLLAVAALYLPAFAGCAEAVQDLTPEAAAAAPRPSIVLDKPIEFKEPLFGLTAAVVAPGTYTPRRRYADGYIYMAPDRFITVGGTKRIGGIYWRDGAASPEAYCYYASEFVPSIKQTDALKHIQKAA